MEFSRQEHWSVFPFPPPGFLPIPGIEPASLVSPALAGGFFTNCPTWEIVMHLNHPQILPSLRAVHIKIVFHETGPWCQKCWEYFYVNVLCTLTMY